MAAKKGPETDPLGNLGNQSGGQEDFLKYQPGQTDPFSPGQILPGGESPDSLQTSGTSGPDQPLVDFQQGDPSRPYVVGSLYENQRTKIGSATSGAGGGKAEFNEFEMPKRSPPWRAGLSILLLLGLSIGGGVILASKLSLFNGGPDTDPQTAPTATSPAAAPTASPQAAPTTTTASVVQPTATPNTAAQPSATPSPACQVFKQGSASNINVDLSDINLDTAGPATTPTRSSHIRYSRSPTSGSYVFSPVNGAAISDWGTSASYRALGCAQPTGQSYDSVAVPFANGEVFTVKTPGGHYAKVHITIVVGAPATIQWVTYLP